ncbi:FtsX-like permease family protein [Carnobacterium gallinarum]|uniref:ABC transporter permease n=1 Tax=Carnobacterium gallinarum TaxID=2749 RepID=UPI00054E0894|nr:ABC transporter permease [Carnobacterium gallinarum]
MSIIQKLTIKQLTKNKRRTLITIIAVILSTAMVTGVLTMMSSFQDTMYRSTLRSDGDWHLLIENVPQDKMERITQNNNVESYFVTQAGDFAKNEVKDDYAKPFIQIQQFTPEAIQKKPNTLGTIQQGRLPKNENELVISTASNVNYQTYPVGSEITLAIGSVAREDLSNWDKALKSPKKRTFKVVGTLYPTNYDNQEYDQYLTVIPEKKLSPSKPLSFYIKVKDTKDFYQFTEKLQKGLDSEGTVLSYNKSVLSFLGLSKKESFYTFMVSVVSLIIGLIAIGSISVIYTSFSISVSERQRQFGILASVGATPKQLKDSVYFESFIIGILSIPLGILSGLAGIFITFQFTGKLLASGGIKLSFVINFATLLIAVAILCIILFISALIPAKQAGKVSPLQNILQVQTIRLNPKKLKVSPLITELFKFEGVLATKNQKRNRKRYLASLLSLTISITLFVAFSGFVDYLFKSESLYNGDTPSRDLTVSARVNIPATIDRFFSTLDTELKNNSSVVDYSLQASTTLKMPLPKDHLSPFGTELFHESQDFYLKLSYIDDKSYQSLLDSVAVSQIDTPINGAVPVLLLNLPSKTINESQGQIKEGTIFKAGSLVQQKFAVTNSSDTESDSNNTEESKPKSSIEVIAELNKLPKDNFLFSRNEPIFITNKTNFKKIISDLKLEKTSDFSLDAQLNVLPTKDEVVAKQLNNAFKAEPSFTISNNIKTAQDTKDTNMVFMIFGYGFITLISLVGFTNIINTTSTSIALRKREFAILKSVGMTPKAFTKMLIYENLSLGIKSLLLGNLLGIGFIFLFFRGIGSIFTFTFYLPLTAMFFCGIVFLLLLLIISFLATRSIRKTPIIDSLKDENN